MTAASVEAHRSAVREQAAAHGNTGRGWRICFSFSGMTTGDDDDSGSVPSSDFRPRQHTLVAPSFWRIGGGAASTSTAAVTSKEVKVGPACHWVGVPLYGMGCIYLR